MKYVKLGQLASGTEFEYMGVTYTKDSWNRDDEVRCTPQYGGRWQDEMREWIRKDAVVGIKPTK